MVFCADFEQLATELFMHSNFFRGTIIRNMQGLTVITYIVHSLTMLYLLYYFSILSQIYLGSILNIRLKKPLFVPSLFEFSKANIYKHAIFVSLSK